MKVDLKANPDGVPFSMMDFGGAFEHNGKVYLHTDYADEDGDYLCVALADGVHLIFEMDDVVIPRPDLVLVSRKDTGK